MEIELRGVHKRFGGNVALADVHLSVPAGAKVALLGPNGSGKTTLTRAILGLVRCDGEIRVDGRAVTDRLDVASRIAYVPQIAPPMAASVGEVIGTVCALRGLDHGRVAATAAELELDVDAIRRRALRALSGGMRQKLLLALALAADAELLVLDEPTASLDARARARALALVARQARATVLLCSHRLDELRALVDHVVALADGRVVHDGPAATYLASRVVGVIELRFVGRDPAWLVGHGFAPRLGGWWSRPASPDEKLTLLPAALGALRDDVADVVVRDADRLESDEEVRHAS